MIICIEGTDASGKATQSKILAERLGAARFSFPDYETIAGRVILSNLTSEWTACGRFFEVQEQNDEKPVRWLSDPSVNAMVLQSLMTTNRLERGADLRKAQSRGHVVLDRYDASAIVYGGLDGLDPEWVRKINEQLPVRPDLYLLLDVPIDEGFRRRPERRDRYEKDRAYLERVREGYLQLFTERQLARIAKEFVDEFASTGMLSRWVVLDGLGTIEEVQERIWRACVEAGV